MRSKNKSENTIPEEPKTMKIPKGEWKITREHTSIELYTDDMPGEIAQVYEWEWGKGDNMAENVANLICETANVFNNTGKTPRQLIQILEDIFPVVYQYRIDEAKTLGRTDKQAANWADSHPHIISMREAIKK